MPNRAMILAVLLLATPKTWALPRTLSWESVSSAFLIFNEVAPVDRTWLRMQAGESVSLSYDVGLKSSDLVRKDCHWESFKAENLNLSLKDLTLSYLEKCEEALRLPTWGWPESYYRTMFIRIKVSEHPYMRKVFLRLPNGYQQPGLLALKDTQVRRPLIIFRAGVFGNSIDIQAERHLIMQLFEQAPFNLLFLDSLTSPETVMWNQKYSVGGLDEGLQNYQIARQLLNPDEPLSRLISGIHLLGVSMGGHSLVMSLVLNQFNPKVFKSAMAFCPLIEFKKTFDQHRSTYVGYFFMNFWAYFRLGNLRDRIPNLSLTRFLTDTFKSISENYQGPLTDDGQVQFPNLPDFSIKNFDQGNDLSRMIPMIQDPVTVFSTQADSLVPFDINFASLKAQAEGKPNFNLIELPKGYHCTFPGSYDWDQFSAMVRDQFLLQEKSLSDRHEKMTISLASTTDEIPENAELQFSTSVGSNHILVQLKNRIGEILSSRVPIEQLDWATAKWVRTETESRALLRWARSQFAIQRAPHPELFWYRIKPEAVSGAEAKAKQAVEKSSEAAIKARPGKTQKSGPKL